MPTNAKVPNEVLNSRTSLGSSVISVIVKRRGHTKARSTTAVMQCILAVTASGATSGAERSAPRPNLRTHKLENRGNIAILVIARRIGSSKA